MKKSIPLFLVLVLFSLLITPCLAFGQAELYTEVTYPEIGGGTIPPQKLQEEGVEASLWPSYFTTYVFRLLFLISFSIVVLVLLYGALLYITSPSSPSRSVKAQSAKEWITGAIQGALVISFSFLILSSIGNQFVLFRQIDIASIRTEHTPITLDWSISNQYFQIPFGPIIEKAVINREGKKNIYNIYIKARQVERTAHKLEEVIEEMLASLSICPLNKECEGVFPPGPGPENPGDRSRKINIFADSLNLITAKSYLDGELYNFIDITSNNFTLPIHNWQQGDVILASPDIISENDFNAIGGSAIRLFGEDRLTTEMALRLATRHSKDDEDYGFLDIKHLEDFKVVAEFKWHDDVAEYCDDDTLPLRATGKIITNPRISITNTKGRGFLNVYFDDDPALCPEKIDSMWRRNEEGKWDIRCVQSAIATDIENLPSFYSNNINYTYCPQEYICENNTCVCIEDGSFCTDTDKNCQKDVDCRGTMHYIEQSGWLNYTSFIPLDPEDFCPNLNYIIEELVVEAEHYDNKLLSELEELYTTEGFIGEGLYHLLKAVTLKSLIHESGPAKDLLLSYISFDFDRSYYGRDKNETSVLTYDSSYYNEDYYNRGGVDWSEWVEGLNPNIEYIPHHNDPVTFYFKMDGLESSLPGTTNNIIESALEIALRLKEEGIHYAGDRAGLDSIFPPPPADTFDMLFPPVNPANTRVSSPYGWRSSPRIAFHRGVDFARKDYRILNYPIYAAEDGIVRFAGRRGSYGNLIIIEHSSDEVDYLEENIQTYYGHLRPNSMKVIAGDRVERGEHIAFMGSTGFSTGIHLHFEVREVDNNSYAWGTQVNPFTPSSNYNNKEYLNKDWWTVPTETSFETSNKNSFTDYIAHLLVSLKNVATKIFSFSALAEGGITTETVGDVIICLEEKIEDSGEELPLEMNLCRERIEECIEDIEVDKEELLEYLANDTALWEDVLFSCGIDVSNIFVGEDSERLLCGEEIPVGEAFELTWAYLVELFERINIYVAEGQELLKYVRAISNLAVNCNCNCACECYTEGECYDCCRLNLCPSNTKMELTNTQCFRNTDCDSDVCNFMEEGEAGYCSKKIECCFKSEIEKNIKEASYIRETMSNILYSQLKLISDGFYNEETENVCERMNVDIRGYGTTDNEVSICETINEKKITRHDLIKRKLYLSRKMLDDCSIDDLEGVISGEKVFKRTVFGPVAESRNLQRNTKEEETVISVCCCEGEANEDWGDSLCPVNKPNQVNTLACTASQRNEGCETVTRKIQQNTSTYNWFCCSGTTNQ